MAARDALSKAQFVYASPERQDDVRHALSKVLPTRGGKVPKATVEARNEGIIRAVTFSGVPVHHLQGLTAIQPNRNPDDNTVASYKRRELSPAGSKPPLEATIRINGETSDMLAHSSGSYRREARSSVIHEIGHHVQAETNTPEYFHQPSGSAEAMAVNYADKYGPRTEGNVYDEKASGPGKGWGPVDRAMYRKHRDAGSLPEERNPRREYGA